MSSYPHRSFQEESPNYENMETQTKQNKSKQKIQNKNQQNQYEYKVDDNFIRLRKELMATETFDGYDTNELIDFYWKLRDHSYYCAIKGRYLDATEGEKLMKYLK